MNFGSLLLAQAMIEQAIADWRAGVGRPEWSPRGRRSAEAAGWLFDDERRATFTFADVCDVLGAEPGWMRAMILSEYATDGVSNGD
jgi:hypothetical protein